MKSLLQIFTPSFGPHLRPARLVVCGALLLFAVVTLAQEATPPKSTDSKQASSAPTRTAAASQPLKSAELNLVPYPAKKQSGAQQAKDDSQCYEWTRQSTGIDLNAPVAAAPDAKSQQPQKGERLRGAARGAAAGAVAGEVIDDKGGEGAAVGAVAGAARSGRKQRDKAAQAQADSEAAAQSVQSQRLDTFRKGYSACMETRGYTLK